MSGHTHGPWRYDAAEQLVYGPVASAPPVALVYRLLTGNDANARLIAAAPTLLEAIQRWLDYEDIDLRTGCEYGVTDDGQCSGDPPFELVCPPCQLRAAIAKAIDEASS